MTTSLILLPEPKQLELTGNDFVLPVDGLIWIENGQPADVMRSSARFEALLWKQLGFNWETVTGKTPEDQVKLSYRIDPGAVKQMQGYQLSIREHGVTIVGHDGSGLFYGTTTLLQIIQQFGAQIPCLEIVDWPDFPARGVMLDISRDKVYRMETLYELVDRLASWKMNQLQLYTEHTFAYRFHPEVWKDASPMTGEEILYLDQYCRDRYVELVANQNSFGHLTRWLKLPEYEQLAEISGKFAVPWGEMEGPFSLSPALPESFAFIQSLYDELIPHFSSHMVNVGCDETFDVGVGKSKALCEERGSGRVYLDFLLKIYHDLKRRGKTMQFWGDIIIQHPELVPELPDDVIALEWGYEASHPFDEHGEQFAASKIPFYVCPGTSAWNTIAGRTTNCIENIRNAAKNGMKHGAIGLLNTDWGDNGHWQVYPVNFLGLAVGAAYSWAAERADQVQIIDALSRFAFDDPTGSMGRIAYELGDLYKCAGFEPANASALFGLMQMPLESIRQHPLLNAESLFDCVKKIDEIMEGLAEERMAREDAAMIRDEFNLTAMMLKHACWRGLMAVKNPAAPERAAMLDDLRTIIVAYRAIWMKRNRPGGLADSLARLETLLKEYENG